MRIVGIELMDSLIIADFDGIVKMVIDSAMGLNRFKSIINIDYE